ncbi:MAG: threonine aldolase [Marivirga sp.]|jgi:threonine aldolase
MKKLDRRNFLKATSLSAIPLLLPVSLRASPLVNVGDKLENNKSVSFIGDGASLSPTEYIDKLRLIDEDVEINKDTYGKGGVVAVLEEAFADITGKEAAIYIPTGTLANQLAISQLSAEKTKVFVQDTSHIYRDEADAAQAVFRKRLMPLAEEAVYFTAGELASAIDSLSSKEVFKSGVGVVSIENPVRRKMGATVPLKEIEAISQFCKQNDIKMHLDGARLFLASAWTGTTIKAYSLPFDTVYISLYKYLGAAGGAMLCGDRSFIDKIPHLIKVHGGTIYQNWMNAAVALEKLKTIEETLLLVVEKANRVVKGLDELEKVEVKAVESGTNIYTIKIAKGVDKEAFINKLVSLYQIEMIPLNDQNESILMMNETILNCPSSRIIEAFAAASS